MKTLNILLALVAFSFSGCSLETQDPNAVVFDGVVSQNVTGAPSGPYSSEESIGKDANRVPFKLTWESVKDQSGCLMITKLKIQRTGGDPKMIVKKISPKPGECATDLFEESERFQIVTIDVELESRGMLP